MRPQIETLRDKESELKRLLAPFLNQNSEND